MDYKKQKEKKESYSKYKRIVNELVNGGENEYGHFPPSPEVIMYLKWINLSETQKSECYRIWDEYFVKVRSTESFLDYQQMSSAFKIGDISKVREIGYKGKIRMESKKYSLPLPQAINPYDCLHSTSVQKYTEAIRSVRLLEKEMKSVEDEVTYMFK